MLRFASISDAGDRKYNEDFVKISVISNSYCFVVCDGLGGHEYGDLAARIAGDTIIDEFYYCEDLHVFLDSAFLKAQKRLTLQQKEKSNKEEMKTTVVCMVADEENVYVGHIGDSRFYGFTCDGKYIRTLDHSIPQLLVQSNTIDESQIRNHPNRNMLLKVMGDKWDEPLYELQKPLKIKEYSAFLICSDGFWEYVTEKEMLETLKHSVTPQEWIDKLVSIIKMKSKNKEQDNYSAIAIFNV